MALTGRHLTLVADDWQPWIDFVKAPDGSWIKTGIAGSFFNIIEEKLNFTHTLIKPEEDIEWGRELPNGSFTGMIGMCQRHEVDVALGPFVMSWDRYQAADFSTTIHFDQYGLLLPRPRQEVDLSGIARPLAWEVWISLAVTILVSLAVGVVMNATTHSIRVESGIKENYCNKIQASWITKVMLAETIGQLPKALPGRLYVVTWMVAGLVIHAAYSGVLISLLTVPKVNILVDSLQDLMSFGKFPWMIETGSYLHNAFLKARDIYDDVLKGAIYSGDFTDDINWLKEKQMAVLVPVTTMKKAMSDDYSKTGRCDFYIGREAILSAPFAIAFPKNSEFIPYFNRWLNAQKEAGLIDYSIAGATTNASACLVRPGKDGFKGNAAFTLRDLSGIFLLFGVGTAFGSVFFLLEIFLKEAF